MSCHASTALRQRPDRYPPMFDKILCYAESSICPIHLCSAVHARPPSAAYLEPTALTSAHVSIVSNVQKKNNTLPEIQCGQIGCAKRDDASLNSHAGIPARSIHGFSAELLGHALSVIVSDAERRLHALVLIGNARMFGGCALERVRTGLDNPDFSLRHVLFGFLERKWCFKLLGRCMELDATLVCIALPANGARRTCTSAICLLTHAFIGGPIRGSNHNTSAVWPCLHIGLL
jgi:hypothetical protein